VKTFCIVIILVVLYHVAKQLLAKGTITKSFFVSEDGERRYLLLLLDYETIMSGRGPMLSFHTLSILRIDLREASLNYEKTITRYSSKMADAPLDVFGMNDTHVFIRTLYDDLLVFDHRNGKKQGDRKRIEKKNPRLKGFVVESCVYSDILNSVVIYDRQGYPYLLDAENVVAEPFDPETRPVDGKTPELSTLYDVPSVRLTRHHAAESESNLYVADSAKYRVRYVPDQSNSNRYYVQIYYKRLKRDTENLNRPFYNPRVMSVEERSDLPYLTTEPPSVIVVHSREADSAINGFYVSRVEGKSEEKWRQAISKLAARPALSEESKLYFLELDDKLCFLYLLAPKISISMVDKYSGDVVKKPRRFVTRQINRFLR
jgi:hypothetical protein